MKFVENLPKIILATIFFVFIKNILQIFFGVISNSPNKQYDSLILINPLNFTGSTLKFYFFYFLLYEIVIIGASAYLFLYISLFLIVKKWGNQLFLQISYLFLIYILAITFFNTPINLLCVLIVIILGISNWYTFKKYIK